LEGGAAAAGVVAAARVTGRVGACICGVESIVGAEEGSTTLPHEEQNRLLSGSSTPQLEHSMTALV